jgi:Fur family ferric uptake transcriptional regulator
MASRTANGADPLPRTAPQAAGARSTRQKRALASLLTESTGFRSAQDFYAELRGRGENVGLTTIYNQLGALADAGEVDAVRTESGEMLFRRCATAAHHHHLLCRSCGRTIEVEGPEVERWADRVARKHGFVDVTHTVEVVGLCRECAKL